MENHCDMTDKKYCKIVVSRKVCLLKVKALPLVPRVPDSLKTKAWYPGYAVGRLVFPLSPQWISLRADSDFFSESFSSSRVRWGNLGLRGNLGLFAFSLLKRS